MVRKRSKGKQIYDAWFARCQEAGEQLRGFDQAVLKDVLGRRYEKIVEMRAQIKDETNIPEIVRQVAPSRSLPLAEVQNPPVQVQQVAGQKRKATEVIDLGGDSSD